MIGKDRVLSAIDIGTSKICAALACLDNEGKVRFLGIGTAFPDGLWRGVIIDINKVAESLRAAIRQAEKASGIRMTRACVGIGSYPESYHEPNSTSGLPRRYTRLRLRPEDGKCILYSDRNYSDLLHRMHGFLLDDEMGIVTASVANIKNADKCLREIGIEPEHFVHRPLATSMAVLKPNEKKAHVAMVDIRGSATDVAIFKDGALWQTCTLRAGGSDITKDIVAASPGLSWEVAEELKKGFGRIVMPGVYGEITAKDSFQIDESKYGLPSSRLNEIITAAAKEILEVTKTELSCDNQISSIILTGSTSNLPGIMALAREMFSLPVRIGIPSGVYDLPNTFMAPEYTTITGLLLWNAGHLAKNSACKVPQRVIRMELKGPLRFITG